MILCGSRWMFNNYDKRKVTKGEKNYITIQAQRYGTFTAQRDRDQTKTFFLGGGKGKCPLVPIFEGNTWNKCRMLILTKSSTIYRMKFWSTAFGNEKYINRHWVLKIKKDWVWIYNFVIANSAQFGRRLAKKGFFAG